MKVLFLMISFPDVTRNTNMYTDLTTEFLKKGNEVYVIAPTNEKTYLGIEGGVNVLRVKTLPLFNVSFIIKGISNILLPYQYNYEIKKYFGKIAFDLIITPTPPITLSATAAKLRKKCNAPIYLILRDIFPQNAKDLNLIRNEILFKYFRQKEKKLYSLCDSIGCMSQGNVDYLIKHNPEIAQNKLHLLPNWSTVKQNSIPDQNIRKKLHLGDKFIALFGGNLGIPQKIEFLLEVAEKVKNNEKIIFLLIGDGTEKYGLIRIINDRKLPNVIIKDQLPREDYMLLVKECDIGLVNLSDKFTIPNIPSRTLSYWQEKVPVLAAIDSATDYGKILDESGGGLWSITGNVSDYIENLMFFYNNPDKRKEMGEKGYDYLRNRLNTEIAYNTIVNNIKKNDL